MNPDKALLFLCVANSSRSQMAEGLARHLGPPGLRVMSAGSQPSGVNPLAIAAMREIDIDISGHQSTSVQDVEIAQVGTVITLCAEEVCPVFLGEAERHHWPFPDPAAARGSDEERLARFREVREMIRTRLLDHFG